MIKSERVRTPRFGRTAVMLIALAAAVAASPAAALVVFSDDFNAGASAAWGNQVGSWRTGAGTYDATNPGNSPVTYTDVTTQTGLTDFVLDVDVNELDDGGIWLRSNYNAGSINGVLLVTGGSGGSNDGLYWHTVQNGSYSGAQNSATQSGLQGTNRHIRVVVSGNTYTAYLDGSLSPFTSLTTNLFASGSAGLYDFSPTSGASDPRGQTFDNFQISTEVPEPATLALLGLAIAGLALTLRARAG